MFWDRGIPSIKACRHKLQSNSHGNCFPVVRCTCPCSAPFEKYSKINCNKIPRAIKAPVILGLPNSYASGSNSNRVRPNKKAPLKERSNPKPIMRVCLQMSKPEKLSITARAGKIMGQ